MKTLTDCIVTLIVDAIIIFTCVIGLVLNILSHDWWWVAIDGVILLSLIFLSLSTYHKALEYEAILVNQFKMMAKLYLMDKVVSAIIPDEPQKEKEDEVEADNGTPV